MLCFCKKEKDFTVTAIHKHLKISGYKLRIGNAKFDIDMQHQIRSVTPCSRKPPIDELKTAKAQEVADMPVVQVGRVITCPKNFRWHKRRSAHMEHFL